MALIQWSSRYELQVPDVDRQHRKLVDIINRLDEAMQQGRGREVVGVVLDDLVGYTQHHFGLEERLMEAGGYPGSARHQREHVVFVKKLVDLRDAHRKGQLGLSVGVLSFLSDWLVGHIQGTDRQYVPYVAAAPAEQGARA